MLADPHEICLGAQPQMDPDSVLRLAETCCALLYPNLKEEMSFPLGPEQHCPFIKTQFPVSPPMRPPSPREYQDTAECRSRESPTWLVRSGFLDVCVDTLKGASRIVGGRL